jgi:soluble lytic murein transglycosylase-like protein
VGTLTAWSLAAALAAAAPAPVDPVDRWHDLIERASIRFGVPAVWIARVIRAESAGFLTRDGHPIRSRTGAIGLMQLMPGTWATMRTGLGLGDNPDDPADNILAGTAFLRLMYDRFGYPGLFAAYNAGPGRYARALAGGPQLPDETRAYLDKITRGLGPAGQTATTALFAIRHGRAADTFGVQSQSSIFAVEGGTP